MRFSVSAADERLLEWQSSDDALSASLHDRRVSTVPLGWLVTVQVVSAE